MILQPVAEQAVLDHTRWILAESRSREVAERWTARVFAAADGLELEPRSHPVADEHGRREVEIRKVVVGGFTLLFTVDDAAGEVRVIAACGNGQLPPV